MRSIKEYNPSPMTAKKPRPNPSLESIDIRFSLLKFSLVVFLMAFMVSFFL